MPAFYIILIFLIFNLVRHTSQLTFQKTTIPQCATSQYYDPDVRPKVAVISHDSAISTFAQNPEQGARDAAAILDVQIDWNRHFINSASKMIADIRDAVDNVCNQTIKYGCISPHALQEVAGIIVTIPNEDVLEAVEYAISHGIPVIVYNAGLAYAERLGLTRVMIDNFETGKYIANELKNRGYNRPLVLQITNIQDTSFSSRYHGVSETLGFEPELMAISDSNDTQKAIAQLTNYVEQHTSFDSIISLGGYVRRTCADGRMDH